MNSGIVIIMGPPASGKTTLAKHLCSNLSNDISVTRWTLDDFENVGTLREKNDFILKMLMTDLVSAVSKPSIHIIDDTMHLRSMRKRYFQLCKSMNLGLTFIHCSGELDDLLQSNRSKDFSNRSPVTEEILRKIFADFEDLRFDEKKHAITYSKSDAFVEWQEILEKMRGFKECTRVSFSLAKATEMNITHKLEGFIKKSIHHIVIHSEMSKKKILATKLQKWKIANISSLKIALVFNNIADLDPAMFDFLEAFKLDCLEQGSLLLAQFINYSQ